DWKSRLAAERAAYRPPTLHAKVNQFAIRCFRDTGDGDYIAARLSMRAHLYTQYLWAAEQAVEKYLKCILMLNRHDTRKLGHEVERALEAVRACLSVEIKLTEVEQQAFDNLGRWNADRYLIRSYHVEHVEIAGLDLLVWRLRQYCKPLDVNHYADDPSQDLLKVNLAEIAGRALHPSKAGHLPGGELEKILEDKRHPARTGLIWRNLRYNNANRRSTRMSTGWSLVNSPLDMADDQAVINEAKRWMKLAEPLRRKPSGLHKRK
ncbi:HEPN domain-containing protein, partial [Xanthomonas hortorum pv. cynarae]|uniref:HEPN domain-containing protein n=1 Tax=Xanthomonas hortorum TaxID=56454 RepID=UPI001F174AFD